MKRRKVEPERTSAEERFLLSEAVAWLRDNKHPSQERHLNINRLSEHFQADYMCWWELFLAADIYSGRFFESRVDRHYAYDVGNTMSDDEYLSALNFRIEVVLKRTKLKLLLELEEGISDSVAMTTEWRDQVSALGLVAKAGVANDKITVSLFKSGALDDKSHPAEGSLFDAVTLDHKKASLDADKEKVAFEEEEE